MFRDPRDNKEDERNRKKKPFVPRRKEEYAHEKGII